MSNTSETKMTQLPTIDIATLLQAAPTMLRNCLISVNPKLREIDFSHLQMYIPSLTDSETHAVGRIEIKTTSSTRYKLESKQEFTYARIDAEEGLNALGFKDRTFDKSQYADVVKLLDKVGSFTLISGDIGDIKGDAVAMFTFGDRNTVGYTPARRIELGNDNKQKAEYDIAFRGQVKFTFTGEPIQENVNPADTNDEEQPVDIVPFFLNTRLGKVFGTTTSK